MKTLLVFSPVAGKFFGSDGLSMSQANSAKNNNTNAAEQLLHPLEASVYNTTLKVIGKAVSEVTEEVDKVSPGQFDVLVRVSHMYGENAIYGHGIKLAKTIEAYINSLEMEKVAELFDIELPALNGVVPPDLPKINQSFVMRYVELESLEEMIHNTPATILESLKDDFVFEALRAEAEASVLGKQLTKKDSFLKRLLSAKKQILERERDTPVGVVIKKLVLAYSNEELADMSELQQRLYSRYTTLQSKVNGFKKRLKDAVRAEAAKQAEEYQTALSAYQSKYNDYLQRTQAVEAQVLSLKHKAVKELAESKIRLS